MVDERAINHAIARQINPEIVPSAVRQRSIVTVRTKFMVLGNFYSQLPHNDGQIPTDIWQAVELPLLNKGSIKLSYVDALGKEEMLTFPAEIPDMDVELARLRQAAYDTVTDTLGLMEAHSETLRKGYGEKFFPDRSFALARFDPEQMAVLPEIAMEMIDANIANKKLDLNKEPLKSHLGSLRRSMETYVQRVRENDTGHHFGASVEGFRTHFIFRVGNDLRPVISDVNPGPDSTLTQFSHTYNYFGQELPSFSYKQQQLIGFAQVMAYQYMLHAQNDPVNRAKWIHFSRFWEKGMEKWK